MPRRCERVQYQEVSAFEWDRMIGLQEAGLSYHDIVARITIVMCVWNQWREEGRMQRRAGTGPSNVTTAWDDRRLVRMAMTNRTASFTVLSQS